MFPAALPPHVVVDHLARGPQAAEGLALLEGHIMGDLRPVRPVEAEVVLEGILGAILCKGNLMS